MIFIVTMFSVIFTFSDFQLVYVLTRGGPANATHLFATYAFDVAMSGGQFGLGAAIALSMLPPLALLIAGMAWYMRESSDRAMPVMVRLTYSSRSSLPTPSRPGTTTPPRPPRHGRA